MALASAPGLVAVFDYHKKKGYADLYSLHSWCGILVFVLYFVQVSLVLWQQGLGEVKGGQMGSRCGM
jgi:cytochrome b561